MTALTVRRALFLLVVTACSTAAAFDPPDTVGCRDKFDKVACRTDDGRKGVCLSQPINTPDFSVPGPPKFSMVATMVCVAPVVEHPIKELVGIFFGAAAVLALVIFNMFRRRTLADYDE